MKRRASNQDFESPRDGDDSDGLEADRPIELPARPQSLKAAMALMFAGAALTFVGIVYSLFNTDQARVGVIQRDAQRTSGARLGPGEIDAAVQIAIIFSVVAGLFGMGLWAAMAVFNGQGRGWARVAASALCAFSAVSVAYGLAAVREEGVGQGSLAVRGLNLAIGVGAIALMYRPASTAFYNVCGDRRAAARERKYG